MVEVGTACPQRSGAAHSALDDFDRPWPHSRAKEKGKQQGHIHIRAHTTYICMLYISYICDMIPDTHILFFGIKIASPRGRKIASPRGRKIASSLHF